VAVAESRRYPRYPPLDAEQRNAEGTVVGTALRKKVAVPLRQDIRDSHVTYQSGFIFEKGKLRFDPPPPFLGDFNVSYHRINNAGLIFGTARSARGREIVTSSRHGHFSGNTSSWTCQHSTRAT
jgi:hypothetical protein